MDSTQNFFIPNKFYFQNQNSNPFNNQAMNFNNNFMNQNLNINQMQMMQMLQNMNNINNINNMNNINNIISPNQKNLVDKIIQFYHKNGLIYMNYNETSQIKRLLNHLNPDYSNLKEVNDIEDPLPHIKGKKKLIKFVNCHFEIYNVKFPVSIDKIDLYSIAMDYKTLKFNDKFLLVYMNCILNKDGTPIDCISDGDIVIIIESNYYIDDTYFNLLIKNNQNGKKKI